MARVGRAHQVRHSHCIGTANGNGSRSGLAAVAAIVTIWSATAPALILPPIGETIFTDSIEGGLPPCVAALPGTVPIDVRSVVLHPVFLHNGVPFGNSALESGQFFLQPATGPRFLLGLTSAPPTDVRVLPGVYDVIYDWRAGNSVPRNDDARVVQGLLITADATLVLDMPSHVLGGDVTLNGDPFPAFDEGFGDLALLGVHGMGEVGLGTTDQGSYSVRILPGAYRLRYHGPDDGTVVPANQGALLDRIDVNAGTAVADFDLKAHLHTFGFLLNGGAFPNTVYDHGALSLRGPGGDRVDLGLSDEQSGQRLVLDGRYDAHWELLAGGTNVPANVDSPFDRVTLNSVQNVALDVPALTVNGAIQLNGDDPPTTAYDYGRIYVRDLVTGADTVLGATYDLGYHRRLIPADYDVRYRLFAGGTVVPKNHDALLEAVVTFDSFFGPLIDVPVGGLQFSASLDGNDFPGSAYERGRLDAQSSFDAEPTPMAYTDLFAGASDSVRLIPGSYRTIYTREAGAGIVPVDLGAALPTNFSVIKGSINLVPYPFEFTSAEFDFQFTHNGVAFPTGASPKAAFELHGYDDGDVVPLGTTMTPFGPRRLVTNAALKARRMLVIYTFQAGDFGAGSIPRNLDAPVACVALQD